MGPDPYKTVYNILHEYRIHNADILFREDASVDQLIDLIEGNRKYVRCLYVWNKVRPLWAVWCALGAYSIVCIYHLAD
jgi:ribosome-interacting GTPase 1